MTANPGVKVILQSSINFEIFQGNNFGGNYARCWKPIRAGNRSGSRRRDYDGTILVLRQNTGKNNLDDSDLWASGAHDRICVCVYLRCL
jgi:hypothetical protein